MDTCQKEKKKSYVSCLEQIAALVLTDPFSCWYSLEAKNFLMSKKIQNKISLCWQKIKTLSGKLQNIQWMWQSHHSSSLLAAHVQIHYWHSSIPAWYLRISWTKKERKRIISGIIMTLESTCIFSYFQIITFLFPSLFAWSKYSTDHYNAKLYSQFHFDSDFLDIHTICKSCVFSCVSVPSWDCLGILKYLLDNRIFLLHTSQA